MKKIYTTLSLILIINLVQAQNPLVKQWDYRYGGTTDEYFFSLQPTADGGYILGGASNSVISGDKTQNTQGTFDYWMIKLNSSGNKQWDKDFGGTEGDYPVSVQQTRDKGYILGGFSGSGIGGDKTQATQGGLDYWIVKTDSLGIKQWDKDFGGTSDDYLYALQQTADGGYILGGYSLSGISGDKTQALVGAEDYWVVKTDSLGTKQWDKNFGGTSSDFFQSLQQTSDGGYILGGYSFSGISGDKTQASQGDLDYWIVKINSQGIKQWDKDFGGLSFDNLTSVRQTTDHGYILGGFSQSGISGDKTQTTWNNSIDYWILKTDSLGIKQWDKDFGGTLNDDDFRIISQTTDGGYLFSGASYSNIGGDKTENNLGAEQSWIVKTDSLGIKQWDKTLRTNSTLDDETGFAFQTSDGCYTIANYTNAGTGGDKIQPSWGSYDYWIIKFCDSTTTTSISQIADFRFPFSIYPNPTKTLLNLFLDNKENIVITNVLGEIVLQKNISSVTAGKVVLDVSFLQAGIYFITVGSEVRKFIKE